MLYALAYGTFCPGPSHILKPQHPKYSDNTYDAVHQRLPADLHELPGDGRLGAGRVPPRRHRRDAPQPLLLEGRRGRATSCPTSTSCSTGSRPGPTATCRRWPAPATSPTSSSRRTIVEALKRSRRPDAPARLEFGAAHHRLLAVPEPLGQRLGRARRARPGDPRAQPQPRLPQGDQPRDRPAAARQVAGEGAVHRHLSGRHRVGDSTYYDAASTVYYPYSLETREGAAREGRPRPTPTATASSTSRPARAGGADVEVVLLVNGDYQTDKTVAEGVIAMMAELGIRVIAQHRWPATHRDAEFAVRPVRLGGAPQRLRADHRWCRTPSRLAPVGPQTARMHRGQRRGRARPAAVRAAARRHGQRLHRQPRRRRAQGADEGVPEALHRERLRHRPDRSIRAR